MKWRIRFTRRNWADETLVAARDRSDGKMLTQNVDEVACQRCEMKHQVQSVYKERRVQARADRRIAEFFGPSFADSPTAERRKLLHVEMDAPLEELREQIRELESRKTGLVYNMGTIRSVRVFGRREQDETV